MIVLPFAIMLVVVTTVAILWTNAIEKTKDIDRDDIEFP